MKRLTILTLLMAFVFGLGATTITVGEAVTGLPIFPVFEGFSHGYSQQIYPKTLINHAGEISKLRFYCHSAPEEGLETAHEWVIFLGHTPHSTFWGTSDWLPHAELTQVFSGSVLDNLPVMDGEWMEIELQSPFNYNNIDNLVIAVYDNTPGHSYDPPLWGCFYADNLVSALADNGSNDYLNPDSLPSLSYVTKLIATLQLVFPDTAPPLAPMLLNPANDTMLIEGDFLRWTLSNGSAEVSGYDVYIDGVLVSEHQSVNRYGISGLELGPHTWQVVARNQFGTSPASETGAFELVSAIEIGSGGASVLLPVCDYHEYGYSQSIYLQSEIDTANHRIDKIAYYWNGAGAGLGSDDWVIYMGHTDKTQFANRQDWVPLSQMVQVFAGHVDLTGTAGWVVIELDTPFYYNNADNLVIAVNECAPGRTYYYLGSGYFKGTVNAGQSRSITTFSSSPIDLNALHLSYSSTGNWYPNIRLQLSSLPSVPALHATPGSLDFRSVTNGHTQTLDVKLSNMGGGILELSAADVSIIGTHAAQFSFDPANLPASLAAQQHVWLPVSVTAISVGELSATLRIVVNGEIHDLPLSATGLPIGTIIVGDGEVMQGEPFSTWDAYVRSAMLYTADRLTGIGSIEMLAWDCAYPNTLPIPYKIWAKNTTATSLQQQSWPSFVAGMTLLKEGVYTPDSVGWHSFQLDSPFAYTGGNLIIAVETNTGIRYPPSDSQRYRSTYAGEVTHLCWGGPDPSSMGAAYWGRSVANIMLRFNSEVGVDLCAVSLRGNLTPTVGEVTNYTACIRNNGNTVQANYQVKLLDALNNELVVVNGPPLNGGAVADVALPWIPAAEGLMAIQAKVEMAGDQVESNNRTNTLSPRVQAAGNLAITIGTGSYPYFYPIHFYNESTVFETIYTADELEFGSGTITSMSFYNKFSSDLPAQATKIYLGSTDNFTLSAGWISASELTLVYDGLVDYPSGENTIRIQFQIPYLYTGGNLVLMVHRPFGEGHGFYGNNFRCQMRESTRSRYASNYLALDLSNLPAGTLSGIFPQTTFYYSSALMANDLSALSISGSAVAAVGESANYTVCIQNNGTAIQDDYSVKLMGAGGVELASIAGPAIASGQSLEVELPWTPTAAGNFCIYGKVELDSDEYILNDKTDVLPVNVQLAGMQTVTIGAGDDLRHYPMMFAHKSSIHESIYSADELGFASGTITSIAINSEFEEDLGDKATKIYLGSSDQSALSGGFIPASALTLVFDGTVNYPQGQNTIQIHFQAPYVHTGGNLVMMFVRPLDVTTYGANNKFRSQSVVQFFSRYITSNSDDLDPFNLPTGTVAYQRPQATFFYTNHLVQNDLGVVSITGDSFPTVGVASDFTISIRNNGTQAQANYTVKLMGPEELELASVTGPAIASGQSLDLLIPWTPNTSGSYSVHAKVELTGDEYTTNNQTAELKLWINPEDLTIITVGEGGEYAYVPLQMSIKQSVYETLYYPDELGGVAGEITGLHFYNNFISDVRRQRITIWLGYTSRENLAQGLISTTQLTQVFNGRVDFPRGQNMISIVFDQPFIYCGGANLVMRVEKKSSFKWSEYDYFKSQTVGTNRSRLVVSDEHIYSSDNGVLSGSFPMTSFMIDSRAVGQLSGNVTDVSGQPLSGVAVNLNNGLLRTITNDAGQYELNNLPQLDHPYTVSFVKHGYHNQTQSLTMTADELSLNMVLQPLLEVSLSGTILASDTGNGIPGATITLSGYESYTATTNEMGVFTLENVFAGQVYDYVIAASRYFSIIGEVAVGATDHNMGGIMLDEIHSQPLNAVATINDSNDAVLISWSAPGTGTDWGKSEVPSREKRAATSLERDMSSGLHKADKSTRAVTGYLIYRMQPGQEPYEQFWELLTPEAVTALTWTDSDWATLPNGDYRWAVVAVYPSGLHSNYKLTNNLIRDAYTGVITGTVVDKNNNPVAGATISNGTMSTTTNSAGVYSLTVYPGSYMVTAAALGYVSQEVEGVIVGQDQTIGLNFVLPRETDSDDHQSPVVATTLKGNYPNPFNPETIISYSVLKPGRVKIDIFNIKGQLVRTLVDEDQATGHYQRVFDSRDGRGRAVASGVYLIRMTAPGYQKASKMMLMK